MGEPQTTILALASFEKGQAFLRAAKHAGARVILATAQKLADADWPREAIDEVLYFPDMYNREHLINGISYLARTEPIARIVPLDEYDVEISAALREHLRLPGLGESGMRFFRDKLAMRFRAQDAGIAAPAFTPVLNHGDIAAFLHTVPGPWVLKPRTYASAIGIHKLHHADEVWPLLESLGDRQSHHLIERFIPGDVYHVDSIVAGGRQVFAEVHRYARPPFEVYHGGGVFCTHTLERDGEESTALRGLTQELVTAFGLTCGALHTEYIRAADGTFYFLETAARVGGAHISDVVEAATGVNLWAEWARAEIAEARGENYSLAPERQHFAGVILSLARQEWPDTSAYTDPEIVLRIRRHHHAGFVVASGDQARVRGLLQAYLVRFQTDFMASMPAADAPTS